MSAIRQPRTTEAATALAEQWAELDGQIAQIEAQRKEHLAAVNADADRAANDLVARRDAIAEKLAPWWAKAGEALTKGKRKSAELGGCEMGTRQSRPSLQIAGEEADVAEILRGLRWAKPFLRIKVYLERAAILKDIDGPRATAFAELGISKKGGQPEFFIKRTGQGGTMAGSKR